MTKYIDNILITSLCHSVNKRLAMTNPLQRNNDDISGVYIEKVALLAGWRESTSFRVLKV